MLHLAPGVFLASVRERAVVLDLARDKYLALGPDLADAALMLLGRPARRDIGAESLERARASLVSHGLLTPDACRTQRFACAPVEEPQACLWPSATLGEVPAPTSPHACGGALIALFQAWRSLRRRPFQATVAWVAAQRVRGPRRHLSEAALLDAFFAARPWFPVKPICRLDAIALTLHLRRSGWPEQLVFGVRLEPFKAHCWVQCGPRVINEAHDLVARFSPILAV